MTSRHWNRYTQTLRVGAIAASLMVATCLPAAAQHRHQDNRRNDNFYQGARDGGRGGDYNGHYDRGNDHRDYNNRRDDHRDYNNRDYNQGGIGPGQGAAIGAAGGALLGALFGGGLKGVIVGGAAGAGIGAIAGQANQNNHHRQYYGGQPY
ncbi:MAG TPA: hypothetical protein VII58_09165 [Acidobacteriaceae bacterium]